MTEDTETQSPASEQTVDASTKNKPQRPRRGRPPRRRRSGESSPSPAPEEPALVSNEIQPTPEPVATESGVVVHATPVEGAQPPAEAAPTPASAEASAPAPAPEPPRQAPQPPPPPVYAEGIVEVSGKGFGFLREPKRNFTQSNNDVFVTPEVIRKHNLRDGMWIKGETRRGPRGPQLFKCTELEHEDPANFSTFPVFEELTTVSPDKRIKLETEPNLYTTRVIDLIAPIGRGQRGLIVAPPRTGKTTLLQHIAAAVVKNYPDIKLIILLVDERPEEVTEIRRTVPQAEIMASSNDSDVKTHTRISQLAIERAKRLVEMGKDVFVLMDSLTRMGRAFNNAQGGGGRTMSGGVDSRALEIPRKLFAAARNTEEAGSLTIVATALIETNSRMDDLIFQEFKGTGNMELVLGRLIAEQRIYPAVDIFQSGTRREELLLPPDDLHKINVIRRGLAGHKPIEAMERLLFFIRKYPSNAEMLKGIPG
jgi:transcription termination factor Rho